MRIPLLPPSFAFCLLIATCVFINAAQAEDALVRDLRPILKQHCVKCHGGNGKPKGETNLTQLKGRGDLAADLETVRKIIDVLDFESMPPETEPGLPPALRAETLQRLKKLLHEEVANDRRFPQAPIRRMNRFQYNNAVQDLFRLNVDVFALPERMLREHGAYFQPASGKMPPKLNAGSRPLGKSQLIGKRLAGVAPFPQDLRAEHGFDNRGDHLSLSPLLLESFFKLSRSIVDSPDFNASTCGVWNEFFAAPAPKGIEAEIRKRLQHFLTLAFRRPVSTETLDRYATHVRSRIAAGDSFPAAMKTAASSALASPRFLYLYDRRADDRRADSDPSTKVDSYELASRMSFFLWGSIPDPQLLDLAASGRLSDAEVLGEQIDRMLNDRKLKRFCDSFPAQWLQLERIIASVPDPKRFPEFYFAKFRVSMHMMMEPLLLFETIVVEDRSVLELVQSDFSYRSELLESWYRDGTKSKRLPPTSVPFRRVPITDRREGGVITTAAIMTMTSSPQRTQPIARGAWLATVIFNDPPEPPPADVPPLAEEDVDTAQLTLRERLSLHRKQASCAGCHAKIDPLGFAFENYGPTGVWRDKYRNGRDIDARGVLFRRHEFTNAVDFKDAILSEKDRFAKAFAQHLLTFALARSTAAVDSPSIETIVSQARKDDYRIRSMIKSVILSDSFLHKSTPGKSAAQ